MPLKIARLFCVATLTLLAGCGREQTRDAPPTPEPSATEVAPETSSATPAPATPAPKPAPRPPNPAALHTPPPPAELWKEFSGEKAMAEVRKQVEVGPRPSGTPEAEQARKLIEESVVKWGWRIERQEFTGETPRGPVKF